MIYKQSPIKVIRSYVLRSRLSNNKKLLLENNRNNYCIDNTKTKWQDIFANNKPIFLEIGFGNGDSLYQMADKNRDINYIGIEVYKSGIASLVSNLVKNPLDNLKIIEFDAKDLLINYIPDNSISCLQVFFPDPWPKKKTS